MYDLGCGDGRIVIAAVRRQGVRGRVRRDRSRAPQVGRARSPSKAGVSEPASGSSRAISSRCRSRTPPSSPSTCYAPTNLRLKPRLLRELRPGTRVVSFRFDMGNWEPERTEKVGDPPRRSIAGRFRSRERSDDRASSARSSSGSSLAGDAGDGGRRPRRRSRATIRSSRCRSPPSTSTTPSGRRASRSTAR